MSTDLTIREDQTFWTERQVAALTQLGVDGATNADLAVFFHQSVRTGLDPFARQIYMIGRNAFDQKTKQWVTKQTIQTGIDGFRLIARRAVDRTGGTYSISDTLWCGPDGIWHDVWLGPGQPAAAKVTVYRDGQAFPAVALFSEYAGYKKDGGLTSMWTKGAMMLGKCVEALALRKAYPQDLSGLYTGDEIAVEGVIHQIDPDPDAAPKRSGMAGLRDAVAKDEPVDADVVTDDPGQVVNMSTGEVKDADAEPLITKAQSKMLHTLLIKHGMTDRTEYLTFLSREVGRELSTSDELTRAECSRIIDAEAGAAPDPTEPPTGEGT